MSQRNCSTCQSTFEPKFDRQYYCPRCYAEYKKRKEASDQQKVADFWNFKMVDKIDNNVPKKPEVTVSPEHQEVIRALRELFKEVRALRREIADLCTLVSHE